MRLSKRRFSPLGAKGRRPHTTASVNPKELQNALKQPSRAAIRRFAQVTWIVVHTNLINGVLKIEKAFTSKVQILLELVAHKYLLLPESRFSESQTRYNL